MSIALMAVVLMVFVAIGIFGVGALVRRSRSDGGRDDVAVGADVVTYLLLAASVMVLVFAISSLGRTAFPNDPFLFEPERRVAFALAAIAVSAPISIVLWGRQRKLRKRGAGVGGWTLYLTLMELVFGIALVVALSQTLRSLLTGFGTYFWTDVVVYLAVFIFHEYAVRDTPLPRQAYEIPRTVGAAIGFFPLVWGTIGVLYEGLDSIYSAMAGTTTFGPGVLESVALLLTGLPLWWYRWVHRWSDDHGPARRAWAILVAVASMIAMIGAAIVLVWNVLTFVFGLTSDRAADHFRFLPQAISFALVGFAAWHHHRGVLGRERTDSVRFYDYLLAAIGLVGLIVMVTILATAVFTSAFLVSEQMEMIVLVTLAGLAALGLWYLYYWNRGQASPRDEEAAATPRRLYLLVMGIITAVASAVTLIWFLVMVFQAVLGVGEVSESAVTVVTTFLASGLAAWHLLRTYTLDRRLFDDGVDITPFDVTVVTSHPGVLATRFPKQARMRVVYREDDLGPIDDEMADAIVAAVDNRSAMVWVDESGFRVAHLR